MSYTHSTIFSEGPSRHEEPEEKLWREVIESAVRDAVAGKPNAQHFFKSDCWLLVGKELLSPASIARIERLVETQGSVMARKWKHTRPREKRTRIAVTPEQKRVAEREKYRLRTGFYERRGIIPTSQESIPCPAS